MLVTVVARAIIETKKKEITQKTSREYVSCFYIYARLY